jgi:hypothetical protein
MTWAYVTVPAGFECISNAADPARGGDDPYCGPPPRPGRDRGRTAAAQRIGLIRDPHVQAVYVRLGLDHDAADPSIPARPRDM